MTPETAALMADYNRWMNERLYAAALTMPEAEVSRDTGAFFGSLLGTLNHIAAGDTIWLHRFAGAPGDTVLGLGLEGFPCPHGAAPADGAVLSRVAGVPGPPR